MKKWAILLSLVAVAAWTVSSHLSAEAAEKPRKGVIVGEVISIAGYAMKGALGEEHAEAGKYQLGVGFPVGILDDESGELYVCVFRNNAPASHLEAANKHLSEYMGMKVAAQGLIYKTDAVNVLRVSIISEY